MTTTNKPLSSWAPITGYWQLHENWVAFNGQPAAPRGVLLGPARIGSGTVQTTITLAAAAPNSAGHILLGYISPERPYLTVGLGGGDNNSEAYVVSEFAPSTGWSRLTGFGERASLQGDHPYDVEVSINGRRLSLSVSGIRVITHTLPELPEIGHVGLFASSDADVTFEQVAVSARPQSAFVVMQFTPQFDELFEDVIRPVCQEMAIEAIRASDIYRPGIIMQDIIQELAESQVVIADITPANPNVFYELGYAHALNKPTILLANRDESNRLPFDPSGFRVIFYDNTIRGKRNIESDLKQHLRTIKDQGFRTLGVTL